ncbi:hypothetical protein AAHS21_03005 [Mycobacterium sp. 050272]|uniref:hypothetical protein n=1 Tax=Mycobacterium sp. 050272 TaxID=3142488 RepID=UPI003193D728
MKYSDVLDQLPSDRQPGRVYGQPFQTSDGATVITVERPVGVFVIREGRATWVPAVNANRVALIGVLTGLLAAVIGSLAVLRQPPWPLMTITENR